jgi:hypothetical protein
MEIQFLSICQPLLFVGGKELCEIVIDDKVRKGVSSVNCEL